MKTITLFLLLTTTCVAQIPKKANTIIITNSLTQMEFYNKVNDALFENGYGILNSDKLQGTITTSDKSFKNGDIKLNFLIKDNKVLIRGDFKMSISIDFGSVSSEPSWSRVEYSGMKNSPNINAWNEMTKIAELIPGEKEYFIR